MIANTEGASSLTDWIAVSLTLLGGAAALVQYYWNSRREQARAAAEEMQNLISDPAVKTALAALDWNVCYIPFRDDTGTDRLVEFTEQDFHLAMRKPGTKRSSVQRYKLSEDRAANEKKIAGDDKDAGFSALDHHIRSIFNDFLARLERMEGLIRERVVSKAEFKRYFEYYLELLGGERDKERKALQRKRQVLIDYIRDYEFNGVIDLMKMYGMPI
ncbi:hypothetical protein [Rhizobium herbae]|uniref:DUF4760 domain-containing protein n=1 Tax=Rhizobium herbae TaxID=508661 RepID=A0ABS4EUC3_9HYPH|nr:hypothetical protein [Rhizobium herbae]MBP1861559.1 hypothetical protein [Rhizobium herbae]